VAALAALLSAIDCVKSAAGAFACTRQPRRSAAAAAGRG